MFYPKIHEQTILEISQGDYVSVTAESFLIDRQARELSRHTLKFYREFLRTFIEYCGERNYTPSVYENSKLANILFAMELARRLEGTGVTVNALHPGFVATGFAKNNGKVIAALVSLITPLIARSPAKGAETSVYLASSPSVQVITGEYFFDSQMIPAAP